MTYDKKLRRLTKWVARLQKLGEKSRDNINYITFNPKLIGRNKDPFVIVGGWSSGGFSEDYADLFYINKKRTNLAMCISIVVNERFQDYNFDMLLWPEDSSGEAHDTTIALERTDDPRAVAEFYLGELERITEVCSC